tara:strand:+ start:1010 stop:1555 length:546 start_codon:yes stop_codon:yes gene_type:complete
MKKQFKINKECTPIVKTSPFKGNTLQITQTKDIDSKYNTLYIVNSYYNGLVKQTYKNKENITDALYHTYPYNSQWYNNKMLNDFKDITLKIKLAGTSMEIECTSYAAFLRTTKTHKGMFFQGNIDNISRLKELSEVMKDFRKIFKNNSAEDILSLIDLEENNTTEVKYISSNKYFTLKMNK